MPRVIVILGSSKDEKFIEPLYKIFDNFQIKYNTRIASAHKTPNKVLEILKEYKKDRPVYITVAGKSDALSGMVDANTISPVIACPPYSEKFGGADIYSSLRTPRGVAPLVILEPENAALAAVKILALENPSLQEKIVEYQTKKKQKIDDEDKLMKEGAI